MSRFSIRSQITFATLAVTLIGTSPAIVGSEYPAVPESRIEAARRLLEEREAKGSRPSLMVYPSGRPLSRIFTPRA